MKHLGFYVSSSSKHLQGIFTIHPIKKGEVLGVFQSSPPTPVQLERDGPYLLHFDDRDKRLMTCNFKYINHSSNPNVVIYDDSTIVALRDIRGHEELFSHYGDEWVSEQKAKGREVY